MPRVKVDYVVSFSSEDPDNQASNLLATEVSKKKWLCSKGEPSCSIVLQLSKAVKISAVHIGAHHAALVEVLVGLSEKPNDQFQVLVPSSVFLTPMESRRDDNVSRVRSFSAEQLTSDARDKRWDRVRVVCSQPYNKHCKYGLSFVHIFESEGKDTDSQFPLSSVTSAVPQRLLSLDTLSSDEDEFKPGELFAKHLKNPAGDSASGSSSTDAQIRKATSHALKNIPDSSTKLTKTPIEKTNTKRQSPTDDRGGNRQRDSLMYTQDDEQPHAKIDRVVNRHNVDKKEQARKDKLDERKKDDKPKRDDSRDKDNSKTNDGPKTAQLKRDGAGGSKEKEKDTRKRQHSDEKGANKRGKLQAGPVTDTPDTLLQDVVFVLSGYENPRRAAIRDAALCMGARMQRDWTPACTHLVCAFPNTPKMKTVKASANADSAAIVTAEWIEQCCSKRRRLPWQWFATEPSRRVPYTDSDLEDDRAKRKPTIESDTDEDAEMQRNIKKQRRDESPARCSASPPRHSNRSPSPAHRRDESANISTDSDVAFIRDERIKGSVTINDSDSDATDDETSTDKTCTIDDSKTLPEFFDGFTFAMDEGVETTFDKHLLGRYIRAYGGVVLEASQMDDESCVDYLLCARASSSDSRGKAVRADWVWQCHEDKRLCPIADYALS